MKEEPPVLCDTFCFGSVKFLLIRGPLLHIWGRWESEQRLMFNELLSDELEFTTLPSDDEHKLGDELLEWGWDELYELVLDSNAVCEEELVVDDGLSSGEIRLFKTSLDELELVVVRLRSGVNESVKGALKVLLIELVCGSNNFGSSVGMKELVEGALDVLLVVLLGSSNNCGSIISTLSSSCWLETEKLIQPVK